MKKILLYLLLSVGLGWSAITIESTSIDVLQVSQGLGYGNNGFFVNIVPSNPGNKIDSIRYSVPSADSAKFTTVPFGEILFFAGKFYGKLQFHTSDTAAAVFLDFVDLDYVIYESDSITHASIDSLADDITLEIFDYNHAPSFTLDQASLTVLEDASAYNSTLLSAISAGPSDEVSQTVSFNVSVADSSLFSVLPYITGSGATRNLQFTLAANAFGSTDVFIQADDDGIETANALGKRLHQDTSATQTLTLNITSQPDAPTSADSTITIAQGQTHKIAISDLPFADVDGDAVSNGFVTKNLSNGTNSCSGTCLGSDSLELTMNKDFEGTDTLQFYLKDNSASTLSSSTHNLIINITPNQGPSITSTPILKATLGKAYSYALVYADQDAISLHALQANVTGLPLGLSLSGSTISGKPTVSGTFAVVVKVNDGIDTTTQAYSLQVNAAPAFTSTPVLDAKVGDAYSYSVTFSDDAINDGGVILSAGALPAGLSFAASKIQGTPTASGVFPVVLTLHDGIDTVKQEFNISIHGTAAFTSTAVVAIEQNKDYLYEVTFTGDGVGTYVLSATGLPTGLSVSGTTISGKAMTVGDFAIVLTLSDGVDSVTQNYSLTVSKETTTSLEQPVVVVVDGFWLQAGSAQLLTLKGEVLQEFHKKGFVPFASLRLTSGLYWVQSEQGVQKVLLP